MNHSILKRLMLHLIAVAMACDVAVAVAPLRFFDGYNIACYTMADGMACNHVDDLYRDSKGFLWVAFSGGGLSRFDGYEFVNFDDTGVNRHIKSNFVSSLVEDSHGRLWVAGDGGVDVIDLPTLSVVGVGDYTGKLDSIISRNVSNLYFSSDGALWVSGPQCVSRLGFDEAGRVVSLATISVPGAYYQGIVVREIDGDMWLPIGNTVYRVEVSPDGGSMTTANVSAALSNLADVSYFSDFVFKDGSVWISTDHGLYRYDPVGDIAKLYLSDPADEHSLSQNFLTDIAVTSSNRMVISTLKGLNIYNPISDDFERTYACEHNLNNQFVNMMLVDGDRIFVGTEGGGINVLSPRRLRINSLVHNNNDPGSISRNPVNSIVESPDGTLWVGTVEGGLNVRRRGEDGFRHITTADGIISHNSVSALALDNDGNMWVGTWGGGIDVITSTPPYRLVKRLPPNHVAGLDMSYIGVLSKSPDGGMFVGANAGILYCDPVSGRLSPAIRKDDNYRAFGYVGSIIDSDNRLWIGSADGLTIIDTGHRLEDGTFAYEYLRYRLDDQAAKVPERPTCFWQDADGDMWIGTNGHGVFHGKKETGRHYVFTNYTIADGLANNTVRGVMGDSFGNMWVATINGLSCFNCASGQYANYTTFNGLPDNQFYWNSACRAADGRLLFGTTSGIAEIMPDRGETDIERFPVVFTRLYVGNNPVYAADGDVTDRDIAYSDHITVHESDRSLLVEFSALDFESNDDATYSYRLKGFDRDWITVPAERRWAGYTNLSPGDYVLQVRYQPGGNDPDAPVTELPVVVKPYFYRSSWFIVMVLLLVVVAAVMFYRLRIDGLKKQRHRLRVQIEKSTAQLAERNEELMSRNEELSLQKQQLTDMNRQVQEMTVDRLSFFTNITHEFRTPIALIIGPIERALKFSTNPKVIEQLRLVERNSKYLLTLVNQLMDFRKVESGKMEIMTTVGNFRSFVEEVIMPFKAAAAGRDITLRCIMKLWRDDFAFDGESLRKVIVNLVSNAIKYTPDGGMVTVYAAACDRIPENGDDSMAGTLYIGVRDTGSGINENDIDRVFGRFYQGESKLKYPLSGAGDSGIGLYLCRSIVEVYGGSISVRNNRREGCTFRVLLPVTGIGETVHAAVGSSSHSNSPTMVGELTGTRPTILVVDDNEDMRKFITSILIDTYSVVEASNGAEALELLLATPVDLVVSDIMMPVMDGVELSRRVKENFAISHIPFIMLTAKTSTESRIESYRIGVDDYILKPFEEHVLLARIEGILRARRRLQHNFSDSMDVETLNIATESRDKKFIDHVMETVKENYKNSYFEVGDFAEALGISRSLLNKKLQSLMGQSAGQLVRNYRLNMARELIMKNRETRAMNISEIAYEVGFNDSKYFTRCFTKHYNITPSAMLNS